MLTVELEHIIEVVQTEEVELKTLTLSLAVEGVAETCIQTLDSSDVSIHTNLHVGSIQNVVPCCTNAEQVLEVVVSTELNLELDGYIVIKG